jgi:hypothetical protein
MVDKTLSLLPYKSLERAGLGNGLVSTLQIRKQRVRKVIDLSGSPREKADDR